MDTVRSADGTVIALDRQGSGPGLILIDGAMQTRSAGSKPELAGLLSARFTVYSYDRRGRGDSGDTQPYTVSREIEDLAALIDAAGGRACLYGHSSGACLALEAAPVLGTQVSKLALYEAPYNGDAAFAAASGRPTFAELNDVLAQGRHGDAIALFMAFTGAPADQIDQMRAAPFWPSMEAVAPTLRYDHAAVIGPDPSVPVRRAATVTVPTLVMYGEASFPFMNETARTLARAIPHAELRPLTAQTHNVSPEVLAPVLTEFFA